MDTLPNIPETHAQVSIEDQAGGSFPLQEQGTNGTYLSQPLQLNPSGQYRLAITTADGSSYQSDFVNCKLTPPIDSVTWQQPGDLTISVSTHDPANSTHYYRWDYKETWEYHAQLETPWGLKNGIIFATDSTNQTYKCWSTVGSSNILLGSSSSLSQDVIYELPIEVIPQNDERLAVRYSMLLEQYALTLDAYNYWQTVQKNSQQLGTLFDLQPSQVTGNIHALSGSGQPVIGYVSASSVQQQRIFIYETQLTGWLANPSGGYGCPLSQTPVDPNNFTIFTDTDPNDAPYYFITGGPLVVSKKPCLDCTYNGGTNIKPSFW